MSDNIIKFETNRKIYTDKKDVMTMQRYEDILQDIRTHYKADSGYPMRNIDDVAKTILLNSIDYEENSAVPIISIARQFGFSIYKSPLSDDLSGYILIGESLRETYNNDRIIVVNSSESEEHLRFVIAHELGHYLFEYDGLQPMFANTYKKNNHNDIHEHRANRFAAALLMPSDLFIEKYLHAKEIDDSRLFIELYLSKFFKTSRDSIRKRIQEVL